MLVSVIIPVYNAQETLKISIDSVVNSIVKVSSDYEIICVDDGSKDNSIDILSEMAIKNPLIKIIQQENSGAACARNTGLKIAKGNFIAFNDSDDTWSENHFKDLLDLFSRYPYIDCISGNHDIEKQTIPKLKRLEENVFQISLKDELMKNYFSPQASMVRRSIIDNGIYFKSGMRYAEEGYFFYKIVAKHNCAFVNKINSASILGKKKFGESGLSGNLKEMEKGELSNIVFARNELGINFTTFTKAIVFSVLKYFRRKIIVMLRGGRK